MFLNSNRGVIYRLPKLFTRKNVELRARQTLHGHPALLARLSSAPLEVAAELQIPTAPPEEEAFAITDGRFGDR